MRRLPIFQILLALAIGFLAIVYGSVAVYAGWWPSKLVGEAKAAVEALLSVQDEELRKNWPASMEFVEPTEHRGITTITYRPDRVNAEELIFVVGGPKQLQNYCPVNGCIAWIMDRAGAIKHVWRIGETLAWVDADHVTGFNRAENIYSVGAHPYPNGDLLVVYQGRNTYPYGVGIAKFDKDSNLLWRKDNFAHHWLAVDHRGFIFVPVFSPRQSPVKLGDSKLQISCFGGTVYDDAIAILDQNGDEIDRISIIDSLVESDLKGLLFQEVHSDRPTPLNYQQCDPTHLNDIRVISPEDAATTPHLDSGDLLISLRSINTIASLNPQNRKISWHTTGAAVLQHSPRYMGDNTLLIFDNLGGSSAAGGSRAIRIDMDTDAVIAEFPLAGTTEESDFFSATAGYIDVDRTRNRALVSLTRQGRTLEIDLETGKILWEFINIHNVDDLAGESDGTDQPAGRFATKTVNYLESVDFSFNSESL